MKSRLLLLTSLAFVTALLAFRLEKTNTKNNQSFSFQQFKKKNIVSCSPDWESIKDWLDEVDIPPIPGAGIYKWEVTTKNDSAQFYFNQGINMYYSFHIIESMASFKKAAKFDPNSAMLQWAQALAYGPNINDLGYAASPDALTATADAVKLAAKSSDKEKMLINAMKVRYSADSTQTREKLNQLYVDKMQEAYNKYPDDADIAALYADALMLQHPWDLWRIDGTPKAWTPLIRDVLEKLLVATPDHPGANHYYIHVMEPSPYADKALPSADRLGRLTPGLSHTVHMPSHIYLRTGNYDKGTLVNEEAVKSYKKTIPLYAPVTGNDFLYIIHNLHMQTNNAMLGGRSAYSVQSALETMKSISPDYLSIPGALGNYVQYIYMTPMLVDIRFGRWNEIMNQSPPDTLQIYANLLYHFGVGMAFADKMKLDGSLNELKQIRELMKNESLAIPFSPFSAAIDGATVAENILAGTIALKQKNYTEAIKAFSKAVTTEENMVYNEPRDWMLNPKHYLGNAYLQAGKWEEAEKTFLSDLKNNNNNGWALFGLYQALLGEKKRSEANRTFESFNTAFSQADIKLLRPVF